MLCMVIVPSLFHVDFLLLANELSLALRVVQRQTSQDQEFDEMANWLGQTVSACLFLVAVSVSSSLVRSEFHGFKWKQGLFINK